MWLVGLVLLGLSWVGTAQATCSGASPNWSCNGTTGLLQEMNTLIASASFQQNDTITITSAAGTYAQGGSLTITKGATIIGPGRDSLFLSRAATLITISPNSTAISNSNNIKITGLTLDLSGSSNPAIQINGASATGARPYRYVIIGDIRFRNGGSLSEGVHTTCQARGVVYNAIFDNINRIMGPRGCDDTNEWENTNYNNFSFSGQDHFVLEDWVYICSSNYSSETPGWFESGQGGRMLVRFGSWNLTGCTDTNDTEGFDVHGFQNWHGSVNQGQTGTMVALRYGTIMTNADIVGRDIFHRASWGMFFNNLKFSGNSGAGVDEIGQYDNSDSGGSGCTAQIAPSPVGKYIPEVNNTYHFNTQHGATVGSLANKNITNNTISGGDTCGVSENDANNNGKGWWNENAACTASNCQAGIGKGTTAPTGACKVGVGYWVASDPSAMNTSTTTTTVNGRTVTSYTDSAKTIMLAGHFYKCTGTAGSQGTWTDYWTPGNLAYPHPLRGGVDTTPPAAPTGVTIQ